MTTISASTSQISPVNERIYHQSNLIGDWKGTGKQNNMPVEFKVVNIRSTQAQVEYTHNGHTEHGFGQVNGATITFGDVTIGTRNGTQAAFEFSTGTAKWTAILTQQTQTTDQSKLVGSWRGTSRQNGQSASVQVTSLDGLNARVQFIVNGTAHAGTGIASGNSIMLACATISSNDGLNGNLVFTAGHNTYSVPVTKANAPSSSSSVNKLA